MASRSEITANRAATGGWRHRRLSANKLYLQSQGKHARLADDTNHNRNQTPARSDIAASTNHRYLIGTYASRDAQRASSAAAEERSDEGTGKRRLPAVGCNAGLGDICMR